MGERVGLELPDPAERRHRGAAERREGRGAWRGAGREAEGGPQKWLVAALSRDKLGKNIDLAARKRMVSPALEWDLACLNLHPLPGHGIWAAAADGVEPTPCSCFSYAHEIKEWSIFLEGHFPLWFDQS